MRELSKPKLVDGMDDSAPVLACNIINIIAGQLLCLSLIRDYFFGQANITQTERGFGIIYLRKHHCAPSVFFYRSCNHVYVVQRFRFVEILKAMKC